MVPRRIPGAVGTRAARTFVNASTQYLSAATGFGLGANDPFYVVAFARRDAASPTALHLWWLGASGGSNNNSRRLYTGATETLTLLSTDGASSSLVSSANNSFVTGAQWYSVIGEFASTTSRRLIVNGVATSDSASRTIGAAPTLFRVGYGAAGALSGAMAHVGIFAGTASDALIALHARGVHPTQLPGQLLECWDLDRVGPIVGVRGTVLTPTNGGSLTVGPPLQGPPVFDRMPLLVRSAASTNYTLSADSGTTTVTGTAATPLYGRLLSAASDAVTATGTAASLLYLRVLTALSAAIALTGTAASTLWQRVLATASGAWEATGTAATTLWHRVIRADTATVEVAGTPATLDYSGDTGPTMDEKRKTFLLMGIYK